MSNAFVRHIAPGIDKLSPYAPGKPISELERELGITQPIKLASNENPLGPSQQVKQVLLDQLDGLARYPDGNAHALRTALAEKHQVKPDCVTIGSGSNDVLDMIARVFLHPGRESLFSQHGFAVYPLSSLATGATLNVAPAKNFGHDLEAFQSRINAHTGVIWIANPNNPTGTWLDRNALYDFVKTVPPDVIVVIDEAYFEYVQKADYPDASQWLDEFPNLIVTRTFSKAYGLAALRIGYGLSHPDVADLLNRVRLPFNANSCAQEAALAALTDQDHIQQSIALNHQGLTQFAQGFEALGLTYLPSVGNFITVNVGHPADPVDAALLREGVITRPVENYGLADCLRISIGLPEENNRCLNALKKVLASAD